MRKTVASRIMGIDLGTFNSAAAVLFDGRPALIPSAEGPSPDGKAFASVVAFTDGQLLVGELARLQAAANPDRTVLAIKRKMGTDYKVAIDGRSYTPQEISAMILRKIKEDVEAWLGQSIEKAVITVPAYFNDRQRAATKEAGAIAGLDVVRLVNEPTAASLAYGLDKQDPQLIAVLDLGAGTFDVTIMRIDKGLFEVIATAGDTQLGGIDMDSRIIDWLAAEFKKAHGIDLTQNRVAMARLREAAERAKIALSSSHSTNIHLPHIAGLGSPALDINLTRAKLEELIADVLDRLDRPMAAALADAGLDVRAIDKVILIGGPTKMPAVRSKFKLFFGREPEAGIDPMEAVAAGAAIQAGILAGQIGQLVLLDVIPLSLGIETSGGLFTKLIGRNTHIPTARSEIFTTAKDGQTTMAIHVLQGERPMVADNITLGLFHMEGIPPAPAREPVIEVSFDIDADGILSVSAEDLDTGKRQQLRITAPTALTEAQIRAAIADAERFSKADSARAELIEVRNRAEAALHAAEQALLDKRVKESGIKEAAERLRAALAAGQLGQVKDAIEQLQKLLSEAVTEIALRKGAAG